MPAEDVTHEPESLADMTLDVRDLRDRIARELTADLSPMEVREVAEIAYTILNLTIPQRACLGVLLRDVQTRPEVSLR